MATNLWRVQSVSESEFVHASAPLLLYRAVLKKVNTRLREFFRLVEVETEAVSNSRNTIHQTLGPTLSPSLYVYSTWMSLAKAGQTERGELFTKQTQGRRISIHTQIVLNAERFRLRFRAVVEPAITRFRYLDSLLALLFIMMLVLHTRQGGKLVDQGPLSFEAVPK